MSITLSFVLFVLVSVNIVSCSVNTLSEVSRDSSIEDIAEKMQGALEPNCKVECSKNLDIAFVVDFSSSINRNEMQQMREALRIIAGRLDYGKDLARACFVEFYGKSNLVFTLQQGITKAAVNASIYTNFACSVAPVLGGGIETCSSTKSGTGVSTGVRRAAQHLKANPRVPAGYQVILTITDGKANTLYDPVTNDGGARCDATPANKWVGPTGCEWDIHQAILAAKKDLGDVSFFSVGVDQDNTIDTEDMLILADNKSAQYTFVDNFAKLPSFADKIVDQFCAVKCTPTAAPTPPTNRPTIAPTRAPTPPPTPAPTRFVPPGCKLLCSENLEIAVVVDFSGSVNRGEMANMREALRIITGRLDFGPALARATYIEFYSQARVRMTLAQGVSMATVNSSIYSNFACCLDPVLGGGDEQCCLNHSGTAISTGFRTAVQHLKANSRPGSTKIILTFSDGKHNTAYNATSGQGGARCLTGADRFTAPLGCAYDLAQAIEYARAELGGSDVVNFFSVGVDDGGVVNDEEMIIMAGNNSARYTLVAGGFANLPGFADRIVDNFCSIKCPPTRAPTVPTPAPTRFVPPGCKLLCSENLEIALIVDFSGSINRDEMTSMREALRIITGRLDYGPALARATYIEFYADANVKMTLPQGVSASAVNSSIYTSFACCANPVLGGGIEQCCLNHSGTAISTGFRRAVQHLKANSRPGSSKILLTFSDGKHNRLYNATTDTSGDRCVSEGEARWMAPTGCEWDLAEAVKFAKQQLGGSEVTNFFSVGVDADGVIDEEDMVILAGGDINRYTLVKGGFANLPAFADRIVDNFCSIKCPTEPPTSPTSRPTPPTLPPPTRSPTPPTLPPPTSAPTEAVPTDEPTPEPTDQVTRAPTERRPTPPRPPTVRPPPTNQPPTEPPTSIPCNPPTCDDENPCTVDVCLESGVCSNLLLECKQGLDNCTRIDCDMKTGECTNQTNVCPAGMSAGAIAGAVVGAVAASAAAGAAVLGMKAAGASGAASGASGFGGSSGLHNSPLYTGSTETGFNPVADYHDLL